VLLHSAALDLGHEMQFFLHLDIVRIGLAKLTTDFIPKGRAKAGKLLAGIGFVKLIRFVIVAGGFIQC